MESHLFPIFAITLILFVGVSASTVTPEMYWKNALPDAPMPTAIKTSLPGKHGDKDRFHSPEYHCAFFGAYQGPPATQKEVDDYLNKFGETYLLETMMIPGRIIQVRLRSHIDNKATFLPRKVSDSIPFSSDKLPEILNKFSIQPRSRESAAVEETLKNCEKQHEGEDKLCATSLEAMVSFVTSKLGDHVRPISTTSVHRDEKIKYKISGVKKLVDYGSPDLVVCHKELYPYAVFSCHQGEMSAAYVVSMAGDGIDVEAAVVCHKDTSWWTPKHVSFQLLKVKPGKTTPVCHYLDDLSVVWTKK